MLKRCVFSDHNTKGACNAIWQNVPCVAAAVTINRLPSFTVLLLFGTNNVLFDLFTIKDREYDYRNVLKIELSEYKTVTSGKNTLQFNGANLFNSLGNDFKNGLNYSEFKAKLKTCYG